MYCSSDWHPPLMGTVIKKKGERYMTLSFFFPLFWIVFFFFHSVILSFLCWSWLSLVNVKLAAARGTGNQYVAKLENTHFRYPLKHLSHTKDSSQSNQNNKTVFVCSPFPEINLYSPFFPVYISSRSTSVTSVTGQQATLNTLFFSSNNTTRPSPAWSPECSFTIE